MQQEFRGNVGQVVNGTVINLPTARQLPTDPSVTRSCPQCRTKTWRYSQYCVHCHLDLAAFDLQAEITRTNLILRKRAGVFTVFAIALVGLSALLSSWPVYQATSFALGIVCLATAGKLIQGIRG